MPNRKIIIILFLAIFCDQISSAQDLYLKANAFINTLSPELKAKTVFPFTDPERYHMSYVPAVRVGPTFHDFNEAQKDAALALLKASLSKEGYRKSAEIMELEKVLIIMEENRMKMPDGQPMRDPMNYHFCIFGEPAATGFWGWRFEGHHISFNFTSTLGKIVSSTPSFLGSNPGIVGISEQHGKQVLQQETDLGFALINSMNADQLKIAKFSDAAPGDIITGAKRKFDALKLEGLSFASLNPTQQATLLKLLNVYIDNYEKGFAKTLLAKIQKAGYDKLYFGWAGSLKPGAGHYYRIQGPVILIEYDNVQNNANHVHTVVRDLTNDYGEDLLGEHYEHDHHH